MRLNYLDVLKAFAIISVVLYHAGLLPYGYLGVDLFLVIAGYLTTIGLKKKILSTNVTFLSGYFRFEVSRVVRLLPPLLIAGIVCMLVGFFAMLPDDYENLSQSIVATNVFGNNILAAITTKNYWDVVNEYKPLMHTWYVGVVMQFYLVYPILFYLARLDKRNPKNTLMTMIATLAVVSIFVYFGTTNTAERFYYLPARFFEFAVGGIVALLYNPEKNSPFGRVFLYICYALLALLITVNMEIMPAMIRLVAVVALSVVLICSQDLLENRVTGNSVLARIGAASYSIFIWHQIVLAFCRYLWTDEFTPVVYLVLVVSTVLLSWVSYRFVERGITLALNSNKGKVWLYTLIITIFIALTSFAGYVYINAGVVRDVPELYISKNNVQRGMHKAYNDKIYKLDKPFESNKRHWLVIGNSFGRDFANVILESPVADSVEVSYIFIDNYKKSNYAERFASADRIFLSSLGTSEESVNELELVCKTNGFNTGNLVIVGTKNFGTSNGRFYRKRNAPDYFKQRTDMEEGYEERNDRMKSIYGDRYLDLIGLVIDENHTMPVFTPDHKFVSQDCRHFSMGGAKWFAILIDWDKYLH